MARTFVTGSSQYLKNATAALTAPALTLAAWYKPGTNFGSVNNTIAALSYSGGTSYFQLRCNGSNMLAVEFDGTTVATALSGGTVSIGAWAHTAAVFASHSDRTVYLNGTGTNNVTGTPSPASIDTTSVGAFYTGAALSQFADGDIADVAIWDVALNGAEITRLANGESPGNIQPSHLKFFAPLGGVYSPEPDQTSGARNLTITGATGSPSSFPPLLTPIQNYGRPAPSPILPPTRLYGFTQSIDLARFFPPVPPPIASYGWAWPKPVLPKSSHATLGGFIKRTDPWTVPDFSSALLYITVNGVARAYGHDAANGSIDSGTLSIVDTLNQTPNTATFTARGFTPTVGMRVVIALGGIDNPSRLFAGTILTVNPIVVGPQLQKFSVSCIDDTWLLNKVKVIETFTSKSASYIAQYLLQKYAPGFTFRHVDPSLDTIDLITFTNTDLTACFDQLAKRAGVDWKIDYFDDLWFGTTGDGVAPVALTSSYTPKSFASSTTIGDIITRCLVEGGGANAFSAVAVGETILPLDVLAVLGFLPWYNALGGTVVCGTQRITYTGVQAGGAGSLVGPGIWPASALTLALAAGANVESGAHGYAFTNITAAGESLPSPSASITVGSESAPASAPAVGTPTIGSGVDAGAHYYEVTFVNAAGETIGSPVSTTVTILAGASDPAAIGTLSSFADSGGSLSSPGAYHWAFTFKRNTDGAETALSPVSTPGGANWGGNYASIDLSGCTSAPAGFTRQWYRTAMDGSTYKRVVPSGHNINGDPGKPSGVETAGFFYDDSADAGLGATAPASNGTNLAHVPLTLIPTGTGSITQRKLYRTAAGGSQLKLLATIADNTTTTYTDSTADGSLGANIPTSNMATANRVSVSSIAIYSGVGTVTARKVYRTAAGGSQLKLLATIADNSTTTYADSTADGSLGANVPTSDTSGLPGSAGQVNAGAVTLLVAGVGNFFSTGGWAVIGNGTQVIRYTGLSGNTLTGIPATGTGAIVATIGYNSTVTAAPALTGIPSSSTGSIVYAINKGDPVNLLVQVDDTAAQAVLSALLDPLNLLGGAAGIREDYIQDGRIAETEARARGTAQLALMSRAQLSVTYTVEDPLTASGRTISINLPVQGVTSDLTIQRVTISNFREAATFFPDYAVEASSIRMSFDDLLRILRAQLNG